MQNKHIERVVDIHLKSFKGFFLSFMGKNFLKLYYRELVKHDDAINLVFMDNYAVTGFVAGSMNPSGLYSSLLKRNLLGFAATSIPAITRKPKTFFRLLRAFTLPHTKPRNPSVTELSSLAVSPESQGKGIGETLVNAFIAECRKLGGTAVYLTTDANNNEAVNQL